MGETHHDADRKTMGFTHPAIGMTSLKSMR